MATACCRSCPTCSSNPVRVAHACHIILRLLLCAQVFQKMAALFPQQAQAAAGSAPWSQDGNGMPQMPDEVLPPTGTTNGQQASTPQPASSGRP